MNLYKLQIDLQFVKDNDLQKVIQSFVICMKTVLENCFCVTELWLSE